jgi:hypothetical protein
MCTIRLEGKSRHLINEIVDPSHPYRPRRSHVAHLENNLILCKGQHAVTGQTLFVKLTHPIRRQFYKQNAASIDDDRNVRVLLLKESSILHDNMHVLPLYRRWVLLEPEPAPFCMLGEFFSLFVIGVEQHFIPELRPGSAWCYSLLQLFTTSLW